MAMCECVIVVVVVGVCERVLPFPQISDINGSGGEGQTHPGHVKEGLSEAPGGKAEEAIEGHEEGLQVVFAFVRGGALFPPSPFPSIVGPICAVCTHGHCNLLPPPPPPQRVDGGAPEGGQGGVQGGVRQAPSATAPAGGGEE